MVVLALDDNDVDGVLLCERDGVPVPVDVGVPVPVLDDDGVRVFDALGELVAVTHEGDTTSW